MLDKLRARSTKLPLYLLVIMTPGLYRSKECLAEIHTAMQNHVEVVPILYENCDVAVKDQWTSVVKHDSPYEEK